MYTIFRESYSILILKKDTPFKFLLNIRTLVPFPNPSGPGGGQDTPTSLHFLIPQLWNLYIYIYLKPKKATPWRRGASPHRREYPRGGRGVVVSHRFSLLDHQLFVFVPCSVWFVPVCLCLVLSGSLSNKLSQGCVFGCQGQWTQTCLLCRYLAGNLWACVYQ